MVDNEYRNGTVGHDQTLPAVVTNATRQSLTDQAPLAISKSDTARILRDHRRRDMLASIAEWERASGTEREWWRRDARHRLAEWRTLYQRPERAAFRQAVARSKAARP